MKISAFSEVTGISRRNLIYYDEIDLLKPLERSEDNQYRYYSTPQIAIANTIIVLKESGMTLKEIKEFLANRSPQKLLSVVKKQKNNIQEKIEYYKQIENMLASRESTVTEGIKFINTDHSIELVEYPATPLFVGPPVSKGEDENTDWYNLHQFYKFCNQNNIIRGLPAGSIFSKESLIDRKINQPTNYYYRPHSSTSFESNGYIPSGRYVEYRGYCNFYTVEDAFASLFDYIEMNQLRIAGDAYMEYLLDETSLQDTNDFLISITILVES